MATTNTPSIPLPGTQASSPLSSLPAISYPAMLLETFIPGYSIISSFMLQVLGIDISAIVTCLAFCFAICTALSYGYTEARKVFMRYFSCTISIDSDDDIFDQVMDWIREQVVAKEARWLVAETSYRSWDVEISMSEDCGDMMDGQLLNFSNWDLKMPPLFKPYYGLHYFEHEGRKFRFSRNKREMLSTGRWGGMMRDEETLDLSCYGRSTQPIKDLIKQCQHYSLGKKTFKTTVRRPACKETRMGGRYPWTRVATRPSRPIDTVVLDHDQKEKVLADINEYLHPATPRWYANRGIPYRRGYLFYGPPGTGKTSLSFAIAGIFGLDIYCISLLEPTLTEEELGSLFNHLPRRCVVLLEDIDTAGLVKRGIEHDQEASVTKKEDEVTKKKDGSDVASDIVKVEDPNNATTMELLATMQAEIAKLTESLKKTDTEEVGKSRRKKGKDDDENKGISLSGLLNAIDGVASHEGRVLVMTTNYPEKLDEALIRPGRVDMKVGFTMASHEQIRKLFTRMYSDDDPFPNKASADNKIVKTSMADDNEVITKLPNGHFRLTKTKAQDSSDSELTPPLTPSSTEGAPNASEKGLSELEKIALQFATRLPDGEFTPAEVQGFLLTRKKEPRRALDEVEEWRDKLKEAKAAKTKLTPSQ
ncbi:hypothetical protein MMC25_004127 [Agyrium rufum]|nr:hypothetical protein [Agyrium rufum]